MDNLDDIHKSVGPLLILAAPGTGKTTTLAKRIKYLVEDEGVDPSSITVITFTVAAAKQMLEKISDEKAGDLYVPVQRRPKRVCTMHSLGNRVLKEKTSDIDLPENYRVISSDSLLDILYGDAAQLTGFKREDGKETKNCRSHGDCRPEPSEQKCAICQMYRSILCSCSAIDHDEQILRACDLLKDDNDLLARYQSCCRHLLVDEYQDINAGQYELIQLLSEGQRDGLFVVGDDDQSIYSWRGGSPVFIRNFKERFGDEAQVKNLRKSYRCHPHVLKGAYSIVSKHDTDRIAKGPFEFARDRGPKISIHNVGSDKREALELCDIARNAIPSKSVLILIPNRGFLGVIAEQFRKAGIAFASPPIVPGQGLPLIASLSSWLADNRDSLSFRECLEAYTNGPVSGIPSKRATKPEKVHERLEALSLISALWNHVIRSKKTSLWDALQDGMSSTELCRRAYCCFERLRNLGEGETNPSSFIAEVVTTLAPWSKTKQLLNEIKMWVQSARPTVGSADASGLRLMTFQGAKGLQANIVCIVGLEEGTLPRKKSDMAEQSRLMYVSMTRAVEELHLFHARTRPGNVLLRSAFMKGKPDIKRSRFLDNIPKDHCDDHYHPVGS